MTPFLNPASGSTQSWSRRAVQCSRSRWVIRGLYDQRSTPGRLSAGRQVRNAAVTSTSVSTPGNGAHSVPGTARCAVPCRSRRLRASGKPEGLPRAAGHIRHSNRSRQALGSTHGLLLPTRIALQLCEYRPPTDTGADFKSDLPTLGRHARQADTSTFYRLPSSGSGDGAFVSVFLRDLPRRRSKDRDREASVMTGAPGQWIRVQG